ncbi:MAG: AAA family ATPase [Pegethrix bostrychoides GSE-TBD4-15B]|jgi:ribulose bisphosphate carboxylase small subunit|uniref:AAA family ATPase n=1 Tax=Pegethrix bostrychoides GSE-TBD4-15B TaxID=2839662 RepID=A0A951P7B8_9CYAN|nr:AAA family ATPase [Pegethrix bostrychoides GSE-TBD4-15B]
MSYYLAPRFLDKLAVHITKNYLGLANVKVPLILGIHGRKGEGKTFQCELVYERMGLNVVQMSAGELESPDAGDPARLIRLRYREAADAVKVNGKMAVLMINDIDAGMGRIDQFTQYTVNTQLVAGTLMNIADSPTNVQLPGSYDSEPVQRIPIIVTGNDFATLYAPLVRDGRMEKFYWEPDREDRIGIVRGIFETVSQSEIAQLVDTFSEQSIDFYSALHSRLYDEQVRQFIQSVGIERISLRVVNSAEPPPEFHSPDFSLTHLIEMGQLLVREQQRIQELRLVQSYNNLHQASARPIPQSLIQPNAQPPAASLPNGAASPSSAVRPPAQPNSTRTLPTAVLQTLHDILDRGQRLGIEIVDARRFRTNSWQCYNMVSPDSSFEQASSILAACFAEHAQDYIRLVGIDRDRRRLVEEIVHRPE